MIGDSINNIKNIKLQENKTDNHGSKIQKGCLIIHGFGGNADEVKPLADHLSTVGYKVERPVLKGHTGKRRDLRRSSYLDWIQSAKESFEKLQKECQAIYLVGFSMGGLIAFQLAYNNNVNGLVTLNTPIYYWDFKRVVLNILEDIRTRKLTNLKRYIVSMAQLSFNSMLNFKHLLARTIPILTDIKCPVFLAQALKDDAVRKNSANFIYRNTGSQYKKLKFYEDSGHLILWSKAADTVMNDITAFLGQIR
jgi:carboxylesterase